VRKIKVCTMRGYKTKAEITGALFVLKEVNGMTGTILKCKVCNLLHVGPRTYGRQEK